MTIDPELVAALAAMPKAANGSLMDLTDIPALREVMRAGLALRPEQVRDPRVAVETLPVARPDGTTLDIVLFRPVDLEGPLPALAYFHAGGQVLGTAHDDIAYPAALALAIRGVVAVVDYRLAPETPAPGAAEDGYLAYTHLAGHASELRIDPGRIGLAGASGGGAVAAATALMIRDRGAARPCLLSLNYAMLDDRNATPSSHQITDVGIWDRRENLLAWQAVLGDRAGGPDVHPYCAPGRATDLGGLPETFVAAAQHDVFRDENVDFASRLMAAGVPVDLRVYAHAFHAWDFFAPESRLAREFEATWHDFLVRRLHRSTARRREEG
ncbi:alpha/beta hydrolase fold domain-containing protein [Lentzea sp. NPDC059081]|uniref:alpha/beta hydrolase fold domain-containing protein n=1 Tax=Lentzea sp. NPDC059081 TaxID=3346719 RepID=UPI0036C73C61